MESREILSLILFGASGAGKSTVASAFAGVPGIFKSSKTAMTGETKKVKFVDANALGRSHNRKLRICDTPGVGDMELALREIVNDITQNIGNT